MSCSDGTSAAGRSGKCEKPSTPQHDGFMAASLEEDLNQCDLLLASGIRCLTTIGSAFEIWMIAWPEQRSYDPRNLLGPVSSLRGRTWGGEAVTRCRKQHTGSTFDDGHQGSRFGSEVGVKLPVLRWQCKSFSKLTSHLLPASSFIIRPKPPKGTQKFIVLDTAGDRDLVLIIPCRFDC